MPSSEEHTLVGDVIIKVNGSELAPETDARLIEVEVEQEVHLPGMFTATFDDSDLGLLDGSDFAVGDQVEVIGLDEDDTEFPLIKGEVVGLEPMILSSGTSTLTVRGYDDSHKLYGQTKTKAWLNKTDSQVAEAIAGDAGLSLEADSTTPTYKHIYQDNQSDLEFLMGRAWRIGFECFVADGKLYFRNPPTSGSGQTLTYGVDLISFAPRVNVSEQVSSVIVKGWDPAAKQAIQGQANGSGDYQPSISFGTGDSAAGDYFGTAELVIVDQPLENQAEGNNMAQARLNERSGAFVQAEGVAFRAPSIKAGERVTIDGVGTKFSGDYAVTRARHVWNSKGWTTYFSVSGSRTAFLSEQINQNRPLNRWPGVVTAIVTDNADADNMGRVLVKYPWMDDQSVSCWARVMGVGAGPNAGYFVMPQVNDEVVVAFEFGDVNRPVVIGGLWNGQDQPPPMTKNDNESHAVRTWTSTIGHEITMYDNADKKIEVKTEGGHLLVIDDANEQIKITSSGGNEIVVDDSGGGKITVTSNGDVEVTAGANAKIEAAGNLDLKGTGNVKIEGANVDVKASAVATVSAPQVNLG